ncbi:glycerol dehydrogenase, partial [Streptococcus suis]|nr:glycerol dehydrogenase [Streptococcus suis]
QFGEQGLKDVEANLASRAVEEIALDILISTGYASNLVNQPDFYYNSCHAHAFYYGTTAIQRQGEFLHGVVVAFGVLVLHAYFNELEELEK